jgi:dipeptide/tripeptide permease
MGRHKIGWWATFLLALLVLVGLFVQVYLIATFAFDSAGETGADALDTHRDLGPIVHGIEVLVFLAVLVAVLPNWRAAGWAFALLVVGSIQAFLAGGDMSPGVHAFHGALVPVVFVIVLVILWQAWQAVRSTPEAAY